MEQCKLSIAWSKKLKRYGIRMELDGQNISLPYEDGTISIDIPKEQCTIYAYLLNNKWRINKVEKYIVLFPKYSKRNLIHCDISLKSNWIGLVSFGLLAPQYIIKNTVEYN